jgi:crooked neck
LYEALLTRSPHVKVWVSYGTYLCQSSSKTERGKGRDIFRRGYDTLRNADLKEERVMLLEKWLEVDKKHKKEISAMMPKKIKRRRRIDNGEVEDAAEGEEAGWEEFYDYLFPDDQAAAEKLRSLKILEKAQ